MRDSQQYRGAIIAYELNTAFYDGLKTYTDKLIDFDVVPEEKISDRGYANTTDFVHEYVDETNLQHAGSVVPVDNSLGTVRVGYLLGDLHQLAYPVAKNTEVGEGESLPQRATRRVRDLSGRIFKTADNAQTRVSSLLDDFRTGGIGEREELRDEECIPHTVDALLCIDCRNCGPAVPPRG